MLPIAVLHDVNIEYEDLHAQIDFVVITHKFILVLEVKKLFGNVTVTEKGEFQRIITNRNRVVNREGMYSPLNQVERQAAILENYLKSMKVIKKCPIRTAVTFANPKTILEVSKKAPEEIQSKIIRHDQIKSFLNTELKKESPVFMFDDRLYDIADFLVKNNREKPFNQEDYLVTGESIVNDNNKKMTKQLSQEELRSRLKEFRLIRSKELNVKPFHIFTNKTMEAIIDVRPMTIEELLQVPGIGPKKADEFGNEILRMLDN